MKRFHPLAIAAAGLILLMICSCSVLAADDKNADNKAARKARVLIS